MAREFNFIYSRLVEDRNDIIGHIAYSIYKKDKIDFIEKKKSDNIPITDDVLKCFHDNSSLNSSLESYKMKAEIVMNGFIENTINVAISEIEEGLKENNTEIIKETIRPLTPSFWNSFKLNFWAGLASAFAFALILATIAFILQNQGSQFKFFSIEKAAIEKGVTK